MKSIKIPIASLLTLLLLFVLKETTGQGICDDTNFVKGDFDLSQQTICGMTELKVINKSTATDLKYYFDYRGEDLLEALDSSKVQTQHKYPLLYQPQNYTVLQLGTLSGKTTVACKNVKVRSNNVPTHSIAICGRDLEIAIPASNLNDFDTYRVVISGVTNPIILTSRDIPNKILRNITLPASYTITGIYNDPSRNCSINAVSQLIPRETLITNYPNTPNIGRLELLTLKTAKLKYSGPYIIDNTSSYRLMMYEKNQYSSAIDVIKNINPGTYEVAIPDSSKSYCFMIKINQSCGGLFEESAEICTIPIYKSDYDPNKNELKLTWVPYPQTHKGFALPPYGSLAISTINFNQSLQITIGPFNSTSMPVGMNQSEYLQTNINCTTSIKYRIKQETIGTFRFRKFTGVSLSNRFNFDAQKIIPPAISEVWASTNTSNINEVYFLDNHTTWPIQKIQWYLQKKIANRFEIIDSSAIYTKLIDRAVATKQETYSVLYKDVCKRNSYVSDTVNTIYLRKENFDKVKWSKGIPFSNQKIDELTLQSLDIDLKTVIKKENQNLNALESDIQNFEDDDDLRLQIFTHSGTTTSTSNILTITKPLEIFMPNALTPNNDGINDTVELKGNLKSISSLKFQLYSRNGEVVFEASSYDALKALGERLSLFPTPNIYSYRLNLVFKNNSIKTLQGNITCISK